MAMVQREVLLAGAPETTIPRARIRTLVHGEVSRGSHWLAAEKNYYKSKIGCGGRQCHTAALLDLVLPLRGTSGRRM